MEQEKSRKRKLACQQWNKNRAEKRGRSVGREGVYSEKEEYQLEEREFIVKKRDYFEKREFIQRQWVHLARDGAYFSGYLLFHGIFVNKNM